MTKQYYLPPEWAEQYGIMLTWPHKDTDWKPYLADITETFLQLSEAIASRERLIIATPCAEGVRSLLSERLKSADMANVAVYQCPSNDTWARDHGPITLCKAEGHHVDNNDGNDSNPLILDFQFNGWGRKFASEKDNMITGRLFAQGAFNGTLADNNDFVLEGGSIESDGKGTIMTTPFCLLAPNRNQPMTREDIEQELLKRLMAKRIIWIEHGKLIGDDTDGHIDTIVRFAPDDTILYVGCDDDKDPQYDDFLMLEQQLEGLKTVEGNKYKLIRLPMPRPVYDGEERLPATYANFLVINDAIIVPTYRQPDNDKKAGKLIGSAFPGRKVIGIDASTIIRQHGSIHCLTMQIPLTN